MSIFAGVGAGKGWHKYAFALGPDELDALLRQSDCRIIDVSGCVPKDYFETSLDEYVAAYTAYLETPDADPNVSISLTTSRAKVSWETMTVRHKGRHEKLKIARLEEPVVNLEPLQLDWFKGHLTHNVITPTMTHFGMTMSYPKVFFRETDGFTTPILTDSLSDFALFSSLRSAITKMTRTCEITTPGGVRRSRVRISLEARRWYSKHPGLSRLGLKINQAG